MDLTAIFRKITERTASLVLKKPLVVIVAVGLIAVVAALAALRLEPDTGVETITGSTSDTYQATQDWSKTFGGDPIVIMVRGDLPKMMFGPDLGVMLGLEGCLSGNIPNSARAQRDLPQVCRSIGDIKPAVAVYGPGTFVNTAAISVNAGIEKVIARSEKTAKEAAEAAQKIAAAQGKSVEEQQSLAATAEEAAKIQAYSELLQMGTQYGLSTTELPSVNNRAFVAQLIFDPQNGSTTPKSRFSYLFPNSKTALIQVRPRPGMTAAERDRAVELVKRAVSNSKYQLDNGSYTVTGAPVLLSGVQDSIETAMITLLIGALIVMGIALMLVFPAELRLLPLVLALMAAALTYGLLAVTGSAIGIGAVAVLPVLVGLAVDYAIQFHARADRAMRDGSRPEAAVMKAASGGGPPVLAAALATIGALLALTLSPVPLIRGFGLLLVAGVALAIVVVLTLGFSTLGWAGGAATRKSRREPAEQVARRLRVRQAFGVVVNRPARVMAIAAVLGVLGWAAGLASPVTTDVQQLVPSGLRAVKDAKTLQNVTGTAGTVDVLVRAKDVTEPSVIKWMQEYQTAVLADAGYSGSNPRCETSKLCPALSITELFEGQELTKRRVRQLLASVGDFSRGVVSPGKRAATLAFGIRQQSLNDQKEVIDSMRDRLDPPPGVTAEVVGLSALAADASGALSNPLRRALISAVALLMLFLVILAVVRSPRRALPPILTVTLAAGISALLLFVARIELNPMSAALGVFIVAIAGEFTLLIYMQYLRERAADGALGIERAYRRAYRSVGAAVFASGVTAIAGFATLALTDISMLRGFALVAVVDLAVALAATVLLLPVATMWVEGDRGVGSVTKRDDDLGSGSQKDADAESDADLDSEPALATD
ncbi:MAG: MMPL family transporter [Solirubrobacterales bacterium]